MAAAASSLRGAFQSGFVPGVDDWDFSNEGDYLNSGGYCGGASVTAIHRATPGTQIGLAGGVRFTASRNGMVMTGTISLTIWWIDEDDDEVSEPGEEFRLPFTAVRMK